MQVKSERGEKCERHRLFFSPMENVWSRTYLCFYAFGKGVGQNNKNGDVGNTVLAQLNGKLLQAVRSHYGGYSCACRK